MTFFDADIIQVLEGHEPLHSRAGADSIEEGLANCFAIKWSQPRVNQQTEARLAIRGLLIRVGSLLALPKLHNLRLITQGGVEEDQSSSGQ